MILLLSSGGDTVQKNLFLALVAILFGGAEPFGKFL